MLRHHLRRAAIDGDEGGAERLMTRDDSIEALSQRLQIEHTAQAKSSVNVIERGIRLQLVEKPLALLAERKRGRVAVGSAWNKLLTSGISLFLEHLLQQCPLGR